MLEGMVLPKQEESRDWAAQVTADYVTAKRRTLTKRCSAEINLADVSQYTSLVLEPSSECAKATQVYKGLVDRALKRWRAAQKAPNDAGFVTPAGFLEDTLVNSELAGCIFVGHVNTDLDSIAGAIAGADLYNGVPARAESEFNGEIAFALELCGIEAPPFFEEIPGGAKEDPSLCRLRKVCLVDHNEVKQMTRVLRDDEKRMQRIVGLVDHHAIAQSFSSKNPLFLDVRPWGSMSTIMALNYLRSDRVMENSSESKQGNIALLLLCAILSDTLNCKSVTTTARDKFAVALLAAWANVEDVDMLAADLFAAKMQWFCDLGAYELIRGDQKDFEDKQQGVRFSIAVAEVTSIDTVLSHVEDIVLELRIFKCEKGDIRDDEGTVTGHRPEEELHAAFFFIVDVVQHRAVLVVCGSREKFIADRAFPEAKRRAPPPGVIMRPPSDFMKAEDVILDVGSLVSRKLEFLPMCERAIAECEELPVWFYSSAGTGNEGSAVPLMLTCTKEGVTHDSQRVHRDSATMDRLKNEIFHISEGPNIASPPACSGKGPASPEGNPGPSLPAKASQRSPRTSTTWEKLSADQVDLPGVPSTT